MRNLIMLIVALTWSTQLYAGKVIKSLPKRGIYVVSVESNKNEAFKPGDIVSLRSKKFPRSLRASVIASNSRKVTFKVNAKNKIASAGDHIAIRKISKESSMSSLQATSGSSSNFAGYYIDFSLLTAAVGRYSGSLGMAVSDSITLGLFGEYEKDSTDTDEFIVLQAGVDSMYFFTDALKDSGFLTFSPYYLSSEYSSKLEDFSGKISFVGVRSLLGYQWLWDSGIRLSCGIGARFNHVLDSELINDSESYDVTKYWKNSTLSDSIRPAADISLGYVF
jgi:hypothetical protein